jgi:hypothetical protein
LTFTAAVFAAALPLLSPTSSHAATYTADVVVSIKQIPAPAGAVTGLWFEITTTNKGPNSTGSAGSTWIHVVLPPYDEIEQGSCANTSAGDKNQDCSISPGGFPPGQTVTHQIGIEPTEAGPFEVFVEFKHGHPPNDTWTDPNPSDNTARLNGSYTPTAPPPPPPEKCTIEDLKAHPAFYGSLRGSVKEFGQRWRRRPDAPKGKGRLILNNIFACGHGKITARITLRRRHKLILLAKASRTLNYKSRGRVAVKVKLTKKGRELRKKRPCNTNAKVKIRVFDEDGARVTYTRKVRLGSRCAAVRR